MSLQYTPVDEYSSIYDSLQATFAKGTALPLAWRKHQLLQVARMGQENKDAFISALKADLNRPVMETLVELGSAVERAILSAQQLDEWAQPEMVTVPEWQQSWLPTIYKTLLGVVLIISPWNYPVLLALQPLIGAIAAGCPSVLKVSEIADNSASLMTDLLPKYLDPSAFRIINGGPTETTRLLEFKWDHIFYTGNGRVGRIVAAAAAKHLTPITLELGGKSPVFIDDKTDLKVAAQRILWGKTTNAGQICIAPDYVLVPRGSQEALLDVLKEELRSFYPDGALTALGSVPQPMWSPVEKLTSNVLLSNLHCSKDVSPHDVLLEDEIFGPFLPLVPVDDLQEALEYINARPHPLALYVFTHDPQVKQSYPARSGSIIFNDTFQQVAVSGLPFSRIGESGYGSQTMKYTYDRFTHLRSSVDIPLQAEQSLGARYPPYSAENTKIIGVAADLKIPMSNSVDGIVNA
ncbi:aldehyde dehydrogenase [Auriscalpium vulgare]|uniref:Aldehyde dehydrogenase n=1 Tax=Auriscalpium vulgare TaxID=40419 RepID=A0ACB8RCV0_9AGAM|nr:aldehyde dehydrogenase [Auriscalpium vulgare]